MPWLSKVCWVSGNAAVLLGAVTTNDFPSLTDNLLYWPAGNNQVLMAARMITSIRMEIGLGKDRFWDMLLSVSRLSECSGKETTKPEF